nr:hypothetical protein [Tanacetum cinerariifolium]
MDLLAFIRTADPTKVRIAERQRAEDEPRVLESTVGHVVPLHSIAPARASSELEASVDRLFDEGASGDGQDADVQPVAVTTNTIVEDVAPLQPRRQRKRKTVVANVGGPSHPPKKLREAFGALGGVSTAGKSMVMVQSLFSKAMLEAEARGEPVPTLPFVTSSVSFAPAIATVTNVTTAIDTEATASRAPVAPSLFGVGSSSTGRSDSVPGRFSDVSGSDFLIGGICTVVDPDSDLQKVYLFTEFNVGAARQISLNVEVRMRAEYNIREKRKLRAVVDEQAELLKTKDGEIESLKAQLLLKEAEAAEAICLRAERRRPRRLSVFELRSLIESTEQSLRGKVRFLRDQNTALEREKNELNVKVTDLSASVKVREQEVDDLDAQVTAVKLQNDNLVGQVHELEISSAGLQEKVVAYEGFVSQLEKFQDEKLEEVNEKFDKLCVDFVEMALHLKEKFNPYLLTTISGRLQEKVVAYEGFVSQLKKFQDEKLEELMVPIHHSPDQRVIGASALTFSLEVSNSRVKKMRENISNHVLALRGMFVPLSEPLSAMALEGMESTFGSTPDVVATLSMTFVSASDARVDDETATDNDMDLFISNADLNISE